MRSQKHLQLPLSKEEDTYEIAFVCLTLDVCDPMRVRVVPGEERMVTHGSEAWATFDQRAGTMSAEGHLQGADWTGQCSGSRHAGDTGWMDDLAAKEKSERECKYDIKSVNGCRKGSPLDWRIIIAEWQKYKSACGLI